MSNLEVSKGLFDQVIMALQDAIPEEKEKALKEEKEGGSLESEALRDRLLVMVPEELRNQALESTKALTDVEAFHTTSQLHKRNPVRESMHWLVYMFLSHPFWREFTNAAARGKREEKEPKPAP